MKKSLILAFLLSLFSSLAQAQNFTATFDFDPATNATDIFELCAGSQTVVLRDVSLSGTLSLLTSVKLTIIRRTTRDTGGSPVTVTPTLYYNTLADPATAAFRYFGANPSALGTADGNWDKWFQAFTGTVTGIVGLAPVNRTFSNAGIGPLVLTANQDCACLNANSDSPSSWKLVGRVNWDEN